jgi:para-nitrobenzyl esterase
VSAFRGVPYGASTAGSGRFMPPEKPQPWTGVKDTVELGASLAPGRFHADPRSGRGGCKRTGGRRPAGAQRLDSQRRPRTQTPRDGWLHGGGFTSGSGGFKIYDGVNLAARHDVVVATINHRLNDFGYLYLADLGGAKYANSSNVGMLDIVAALEWVRDNISNFGGDPANVTIFGQSGGAAKVSTLLAMPAAKGLFHRGIIESAPGTGGVWP